MTAVLMFKQLERAIYNIVAKCLNDTCKLRLYRQGNVRYFRQSHRKATALLLFRKEQ
uniref:Uncharacterized protein n=1 Tax=Arundo donax TaxID=35708 RepID=A0A0A9HE10_ARUDO